MKQSKEFNQRRKGVLPRPPERSACAQRYWMVLTVCLILVVASSCTTTPTATDTASDDQWNIMVVPSRQTVFSENSRALFNKNCASCHSKDGRAQTPIARQRHVQDLSECTLEDNAIVEQILRGTHNKANTFRMPAFTNKLTRAEMESLLPLVKAFRPAPPATSNPASNDVPSGNPRLVGIVNLPSFEYAIFEKGGSRGRYFLLRERESHDGVTLLKLNLMRGTARVEVGGTNPVLDLALDDQAGLTKRTGISGFLKNLGDAFSAPPEGVVLKGANVDLVLFLFSQFSGETLLPSPRLLNASFDLKVGTGGPGDAARKLRKALVTNGITTVWTGGDFAMVVPEAEAPAARILASKFKSLQPTESRSGLFPGRTIINFPDTDLSEVVKLYADLTGRRLDQTQPLPALSGKVNFTTQAPLNTDACIHATEMLLALHGLRIVPVGSDTFRIGLLSGDDKS